MKSAVVLIRCSVLPALSVTWCLCGSDSYLCTLLSDMFYINDLQQFFLIFLRKHKRIPHLRVMKVWRCDAERHFCRCFHRGLLWWNNEETQREEGALVLCERGSRRPARVVQTEAGGERKRRKYSGSSLMPKMKHMRVLMRCNDTIVLHWFVSNSYSAFYRCRSSEMMHLYLTQ